MIGQHKFYHWSILPVYAGLSLAILSYDVIICGGTLIIFMDVEYLWIDIRQGKICRQYSLLTCNSFIGQLVHSVGGEEMGHRGWKGRIVI